MRISNGLEAYQKERRERAETEKGGGEREREGERAGLRQL